jgi:hypothetical protein
VPLGPSLFVVVLEGWNHGFAGTLGPWYSGSMPNRTAEKAELLSLLAARAPMSPAERDEQMRDAVYGNVGLEYPNVTRAMVDRVFEQSSKR